MRDLSLKKFQLFLESSKLYYFSYAPPPTLLERIINTFLSTYYAPTVLVGTEDTAVDKTAAVSFPTSAVHILMGVVHTHAHTGTFLPLCDAQVMGVEHDRGAAFAAGQ